MKKELVNSYKTWNYSFYRIEANIETDLWCKDLVKSFEKKIHKILKEFSDEVIIALKSCLLLYFVAQTQ